MTALQLTPYGPWAAHVWPTWVPTAIRVQIEDIWSTPAVWRLHCRSVQAPPIGAVLRVTTPTGSIATGQYIHVRNGMGRLIPSAGKPIVVTLIDGRPRWVIGR